MMMSNCIRRRLQLRPYGMRPLFKVQVNDVDFFTSRIRLDLLLAVLSEVLTNVCDLLSSNVSMCVLPYA